MGESRQERAFTLARWVSQIEHNFPTPERSNAKGFYPTLNDYYRKILEPHRNQGSRLNVRRRAWALPLPAAPQASGCRGESVTRPSRSCPIAEPQAGDSHMTENRFEGPLAAEIYDLEHPPLGGPDSDGLWLPLAQQFGGPVLEHLWGDRDRSQFTSDSPCMIFLGRRTAGRRSKTGAASRFSTR